MRNSKEFIKKRKKFSKKKKIRILKKIFLRLLLIFFISLFIIFIVQLLKVYDVNVVGNEYYENQEIINCSEIQKGNNIIFINTKKSESQIYNSLRYIDDVKIHKKFFNKIEINVKNGSPVFAFQVENNYILASEKGRILEKVDSLSEYDLPLIQGIKLCTVELGDSVKFVDEEIEKSFNKILTEWNVEFEKLFDLINFEDKNKIFIKYNKNLEIFLGNTKKIKYKFQVAKSIICDKLNENDIGVLDLSEIQDSNYSYFIPKDD